eukprot:CAMPEP_0174386504 /NCGR_PEP_ID=MMETSP0811_2-20130205/127323_1 /TAXON_ID=73025 ORGANISM="Eutreptiella gymnastica-like, Strain CCMP1594" /NCGR_SAMPLE_ID=MMETSP0811_2 /ASSEMBLY_ACC=CAM_ASM_000667 /LENGTH=55 /DNA_ID=CAMNT_0015541205 /DNA_START=2108 /DNA_END=2275 /DNA_ORIENTATION=-
MGSNRSAVGTPWNHELGALTPESLLPCPTQQLVSAWTLALSMDSSSPHEVFPPLM